MSQEFLALSRLSQLNQPQLSLISGARFSAEAARYQVEGFRRRFGILHHALAMHAAFPLALTPDILYRLRMQFQRTVTGRQVDIPWIAVADILLSNLCTEVDDGLYEMDLSVRSVLLAELRHSADYGDRRIRQLADFLLYYVWRDLESYDVDRRDLAQAQRWNVLAYVDPNGAVRELAQALRAAVENRLSSEQVRLSQLIETFVEPLSEFVPLLTYARGVWHHVHGDVHTAQNLMSTLQLTGSAVLIAGIHMPVPSNLRPDLNYRPFAYENEVLREMEAYLGPDDFVSLHAALDYAHTLARSGGSASRPDAPNLGDKGHRVANPTRQTNAYNLSMDFDSIVGVIWTMVRSSPLDVVTVGAILLGGVIYKGLTADDIRSHLPGDFGDEIVRAIADIAQFEILPQVAHMQQNYFRRQQNRQVSDDE